MTMAVLVTLSACGLESDPGLGLPEDPGAPVIQITSEGGFAPVDMILGRGPLYTLLADGRLIYEGPTIAVFPGPLIPNYQVTRIDDQQMQLVLDLVDQMGLPDFERELDDTAASRVADATTEVITYWDQAGEQHVYAVYALGIDLDESLAPATESFAELFELMGDLVSGDADPYEADRVRIVAGPGFVNDEFEDVRDWPLGGEDISEWAAFPNDWKCKVFEPSILDVFTDATQVTVWDSPDPDRSDSPIKLAVRPLHPGEPDCPTS